MGGRLKDSVWACVRCCVFGILSIVLLVGLSVLLRFCPFVMQMVRGAGPTAFLTPLGVLPDEVSQLIAVCVAAFSLSYITEWRYKKNNWATPYQCFIWQMNLYDRKWLYHSVTGVFWGIFCALSVIGIIWIWGGYHFRVVAPSWGVGIAHLIEYMVTFLIVGAGEEAMFRCYMHHQLGEAFGFWPATLVTSLLFGLIHLPGGTPLWGAVQVGLVGIVFCMMLRHTGSAVFAIGFHAAWDWTQSALCGVNDSGHPASGTLLRGDAMGSHWVTGGSDGPEGSIICVALFVILIVWFFPKNHKSLEY